MRSPAASPDPEPLSSELAQRVVDTVTTRMDRHVNVMDAHGVIIASSDPERIGTLHHAALRVIADGRAVTVTVPEVGSSDRPGVNEPLVVDGRLVGVVGVTGDPREVGQLATVVALGVQLLITQERSYDAATRRATAARELIAALTSGRLDAGETAALLRVAGLGTGPWTLSVWAEAASDGAAASAPPVHASQLAADLSSREHHRAAVMHGLLWILTRAPHAPNVDGARGLRVLRLTDPGQLLARAVDLRALARYPRLLPVGGQEVDDAAALLLGVGHLPPASLAQRAATVVGLAPSDAETVSAMAGATTLAAAAAALFVHRNTLVQRVTRIRERTGLDPRVPAQLAALQLGLLAREALGDGPG
ncbi:sugar diacid recognition domain-containing protein [Serinibacter arcticus]|uniref:Sugar diacid utilization regulator SdaR n=1 Tax=Serinibacter arcticus TaxID=1655435 RepID=A0A4Z1DZQ8_9MICO|nr:sugar diacid recognition domain-containing protein [Serinibacter arcticus]TGO05084.1 Sugar diacid utilization regulator SdaR [Serinibacter arcticus]